MQLKSIRLLIHHHAVAYVDEDGAIWLPSFIARWIDAISSHVDQIGLLFAQTSNRTPRQDEKIQATNVDLISLGNVDNNRWWGFIRRAQRTKIACRSAHGNCLLIRGITPRQGLVWNNVRVSNKRKVYLLVGSLIDNRPPFKVGLHPLFIKLMSHYRLLQVRSFSRRSTRMLVNSPKMIGELEELTGKSASFVPTNSIRMTDFSALTLRPFSSSPRLLYVGRVTLEKGVGELIRALNLPGAESWKLDIVGPVKSTDQAHFESLAYANAAMDRICWYGMIQYGPDLFKFYREADVLVLPSYHEGFPHVIWEAASQSCPVIATAVGGIPALWKHKIHGLLIPSRDPVAIVDAVMELRQNATLRSKLVTSAYKYAKEFTVEFCADALAKELKQLG